LPGFAYDPNDNEEMRQEKNAAFLIAASCCVAGLIWSLMYFTIFGLGITTYLPLLFVIIVGAAIIISHQLKNHLWAVYAQIISIIYITTLIQWSIGGVFDSGFVMAWAMLGPITALMFFSLRNSLFWLLAYMINIAITVLFNDFFSNGGHVVDESTKEFFFIMNLSASSLVIFVFAFYFVSNTLKEREKANQLLLNILPNSIAQTLKNKSGVIAERHENVSVLFADIEGFTSFSSDSTPDEVVSVLDIIFKEFDELTEKYGLEKIKTIGDAYMVAAGIPKAMGNHTQAICHMALDMLDVMKRLHIDHGISFALRIGIHSGPVVAGVIGKSKFAYDLWGDTVNIASRMESNAESSQIQVSQAVYRSVKDTFELKSRGSIEVKGKGAMETYILIGEK